MAQCQNPYIVDGGAKGEVPVPCGRCPACYSRRASGWSFRLMQHEKNSDSAHFITLTYDTDNVPITPKGFMGLDKSHPPGFFKRLRKNSPKGGKPIKYYIVGEYGGNTDRPHYHAILFNATVPAIESAWKLGTIHYGTVTGASIGYTLKYISKPGRIPMHKNDDRQKEFALMSKGLGLSYITNQMYHWHNDSQEDWNRMYCNVEGGQKISMPRYYKNKIYSEQQRKIIGKKTRINMLREEAKKSPKTDHELEQAKMASYKRMYKNSNKGDKI